MANRRMFSKDIVRSDSFLNLPVSAQALYFHLGMEADDRGYVNSAASIARSINATDKDMRLLIKEKFILQREKTLYLIKGWRISNAIQPSKLVETNYADDMETLFLDENNSYTTQPTEIPCRRKAGETAEESRQKGGKKAD